IGYPRPATVPQPSPIMSAMRTTAMRLSAGAFALLLAMGSPSQPVELHAQNQQAPVPAPAAPEPPAGQQPTFRVSVDLVTSDVIPRDERTDQFIADLKPGEFEIYEDGVRQEIVSLELIHGGRAYNVQAPPPAPVREGIIL